MVTNTPGVLDDEVADTAMGLLLMTARELSSAERYLRDGTVDRAALSVDPGNAERPEDGHPRPRPDR